MNNIELELKFKEILSKSNTLDSMIELKKIKKEYKKSDFYKETKLPINKAFKLYNSIKVAAIIEKIKYYTVTTNIIDELNFILENIDEEQINAILNKLSNIIKTDGIRQYKEIGALLNKFGK